MNTVLKQGVATLLCLFTRCEGRGNIRKYALKGTECKGKNCGKEEISAKVAMI